MQLFRPKYEVEECVNAIREVLESGWTGTGPQCKKFEEEWSHFTGAKYSHYLNSATAALHIALRLLDLPKNSKILTTALTFVSTNAVILYEGFEPVFVDINDDLSMDHDDFIKKAEQYDCCAAIWVHHSGNVSTHFDKVMETLSSHPTLKNLKMIEDCAHAAGAYYQNGKRVGGRNDTIACFSFQAVKNLPTFDGGMICTGSIELHERAKKLAWLGIDKDTFSRTSQTQNELYKWKYDVPELGWKYNGNDVSAAIGNVQLKYLDRDNAYRKQIYTWYNEGFENCSRVKLVYQSKDSSNHLIVIRVKNRDEVISTLKANGIAPGVHYLPNHQFPIFKPYDNYSLPHLDRIKEEILSLPNHLMLKKHDIEKVCEVVLDAKN
jgi:dTDP-4-amino-4,6-dideoxygalactose transaminase